MRRKVLALLAAAVAAAAMTSGLASASSTAGPVPAGFAPASVTFVSASLGWVLGTAPCSHPPCTSVVRTTDGGHTWQGIPAPRTPLLPFPTATRGGVLKLRFADAHNGWAYGTELWATHDGGASWHRITLPMLRPDIIDLEAAGGRVRALIGSRPAGGGLTRNIHLYSTAVASDHWHVGAAMPGALELVVHGNHAWVVTESFGTSSSTPRLYANGAGGWHQLPDPCDTSVLGAGQLAATSATRLLFVCVGEPGAGSANKRAFVSGNGGRSWTRRGAPSRGGDLYYAASSSPTGDFAAAASGATELYGSFDGARHWHNVLGLDDGGLGWSDFGFTTASQGVAVEGQHKLWMTRDGGHHWSAVTF